MTTPIDSPLRVHIGGRARVRFRDVVVSLVPPAWCLSLGYLLFGALYAPIAASSTRWFQKIAVIWAMVVPFTLPMLVRAVDRRIAARAGRPEIPRVGRAIGAGIAGFVAGLFLAFVGLSLLPIPRELTNRLWPLLVIFPSASAMGLSLFYLTRNAATLSFGIDGAAYRSGEVVARFSYCAVSSIDPGTNDVRVVFGDGSFVDLDARALGVSAKDLERAIRERVEAASVPLAAAESLRREGRPIAAWREALAALSRGGFRTGSARPEDLIAVLTHPGSTRDERIGAAIALRETGIGTARLRAVIAAVESERLRVALEFVADAREDEATLAEALETKARS